MPIFAGFSLSIRWLFSLFIICFSLISLFSWFFFFFSSPLSLFSSISIFLIFADVDFFVDFSISISPAVMISRSLIEHWLRWFSYFDVYFFSRFLYFIFFFRLFRHFLFISFRFPWFHFRFSIADAAFISSISDYHARFDYFDDFLFFFFLRRRDHFYFFFFSFAIFLRFCFDCSRFLILRFSSYGMIIDFAGADFLLPAYFAWWCFLWWFDVFLAFQLIFDFRYFFASLLDYFFSFRCRIFFSWLCRAIPYSGRLTFSMPIFLMIISLVMLWFFRREDFIIFDFRFR